MNVKGEGKSVWGRGEASLPSTTTFVESVKLLNF